jgi:twinkle protein
MTMSDGILRSIEARGLDVELLDRMGFESAWREGGEALVIPFRRLGERVHRKYRFFDHPKDKKWSADPGTIPCAWNEDCLRDESLDNQPLIITEGEFDALAAIQCGFPRTISAPGGAPPPKDRSAEDLADSKKYEWLRNASSLLHKDRTPEGVILAVDGDENGAALLQDLSVQLGRYRCKFLTYPMARDPQRRGRPRCKDLNEVLEDYGMRGVVQTIAQAQWLKVNGVHRMSELPPLPVMRVFDIGFPAFGEHYKARLGDLAVWTGIPMMGKTSVVQDVCCRLALNHGIKIGWASFEQSPQRDHRRAFRTWYGRPDMFGEGGRDGTPERNLSQSELAAADAWIDKQHLFLVPDEDDDVTLEWFLEKAEVAVVRHGCQVIVVDPWNEMDHMWERHETEAQYVNRALKTLKRFARKFQVHLIVVAHPTKIQKGADGKYPMPGAYDINGGAVWNNKADLLVVVHREDEQNTRVKTAKSRYHDIIGEPGSVIMHFGKDDRRFHEQRSDA